jgi:hypothetical protein
MTHLRKGGTSLAQSFAAAINGAPGYLDRHLPLETVWFIGGFNPSPVPNITLRTALIMARNMPLKAGRIFIGGGSCGGKHALQVAEKLSKLPIKFIGIGDGAFQREDLVDRSQFDKDENFDPESRRRSGSGDPRREAKFFPGHTLNKFEEVHGDSKLHPDRSHSSPERRGGEAQV